MADSESLELVIGADQAPYWDVTTTPGGATFQNMTGWAMEFDIRRTGDDALVLSIAGASISTGDDDLGHTGARATVTIAAAALTHPAGRDYYGTLWRTGTGTKTPVWIGPVVLRKAAATA